MGIEKFSVDDRGNEVIFYELESDGEYHRAAVLDMEAGPDANEPAWHNWSGEELELWAIENGYRDEITAQKTGRNQDKGGMICAT